MASTGQFVQLGPFFDGGNLQTSAKLYHLNAGLTSDKDIWADRAKTITLEQPLVADANGIFNFFADGLYKFIICRANSTGPSNEVLYTLDNVLVVDPSDPLFAEGTAIPSASTLAVGPEVWGHVTGSVNIAVLDGTVPFFWAVFDGNPLLIHSANLLLPGSRNRKMLAGDVGFFLNEAAGIWRLAGHMETEGNYVGRYGSAQAVSATLAIPTDGDFADVTGNDVDVTAIGSAAAGYTLTFRFTGSGVNLVYNAASMILPYAMDYRVTQNELIEFRSLGSGNWILKSRTGDAIPPGTPIFAMSRTAKPGYVAADGVTQYVCTRYSGLAKEFIPNVAQTGRGTAVGVFTFDNTTDVFTLVAHGLLVNDLVHLANSGGALPTGFSTATPYYVINVTTDTFQLSLTRGGAAVNGTTNGTGTNSVYNKFVILDPRGRAFVTLDDLGGAAASRLTSASLNGANAIIVAGPGGLQTHVLVESELASHSHGMRITDNVGGGVDTTRIVATRSAVNGSPDAVPTDPTGGGEPHSNTQPWMALACHVRT